MSKIKIAACSIVIDKSSKAIQLFPAGEFSAPFGTLKGEGPWRLDQNHAEKLIAVCAKRSNDILIDYEHQSLSANKEGHAAPAAGWINPASLVWQDDGLYAQNPDWKARAAAMIDADEYRYLSPVFTYDPATGTPLNILSVALTNTPAIDGMAAVSLAALMAGFAANHNNEETMSDLGTLLARLMKEKNISSEQMGAAAGIAAGTVTQILDGSIKRPPEKRLKAFAEVLGVPVKTILDALPGGPPHNAALTTLLQLDDELATDSQIDSAVAALTLRLQAAHPDPAKFVPIEALLAVQAQYQQNAGESQAQKVAALIAAHPAIIVPALESWATELGKQDISKLEQYIDNAKPIAALISTQTGGKAPTETTKIPTSTDAAVMKALGLTAEQFAAGKRETQP